MINHHGKELLATWLQLAESISLVCENLNCDHKQTDKKKRFMKKAT